MIIVERKEKLSDVNSSREETGLILLRFLSKVPMDNDLIVSTFTTNLKNEIIAFESGRTITSSSTRIRLDTMKSEIDILTRYKVIFSKVTQKINEEGRIFFYTQLVLQRPEEISYSQSDYGFLHREGNFYGALFSTNDVKVRTNCPMSDYMYSFRAIKLYDSNCTYIGQSLDAGMNELMTELLEADKDNIAIEAKVNTNKTYNRSSIVKIHIEVHDDLISAFESKDNDTVMISQYDNGFGRLNFTLLRDMRNGSILFKSYYKSKPTLTYYKDMAVFYDGEKSYNEVQPYFEDFYNLGIKMLDILQYCGNKDFFYCDNMMCKANKVVLHFISKDRILMSRSNIALRNLNSAAGVICVDPGKNRKKQFVNLALARFGGSYYAEFVIPVDENGIQSRAMNIASSLIREAKDGIIREDLVQGYKSTLMSDEQKDDDVLSRWFDYCTKTSKTVDDGIVKAYIKMRENLEKEYKEIGSYLNCYDFSKCTAIPRVSMDKKLKENFYKSLHIEPKTVIIKKINNKSIKPIQETQTTVRFMVIEKNNMAIDDIPMRKYYNQQTNVVNLEYNKLKGDVVHAKTQNRG